ncbi:fructosamine-3-kinase [Stella humosa]|uniref:Fructosamine-3-kinase n=1 Tax=Stella humosa TaxID=94 RepID=A0A3N1KRQ9_9PROT|nr:phosphotransferase [Stella humosa]ROP81060.1 fructosamine-3-kinase [Stella humosa]BBK29750.1 putative aminoglycoside phosphotransferase [Stella humosa]
MTEQTDLLPILRRLGLVADGAAARLTPLTGGVSSDIWKVETADRVFCVKRALAKLKVAQDWRAPVGRNAFEAEWIETARAIVPGAAPRILAHDAEAGLFAMEFFDPARWRLWKTELRDGRVDPADAARVGTTLARIHAATAGDADIARRFATDAVFHAIRLEPYLLATARAHPDLAPILEGLAQRTADTRLALVHGDVSPKNILLGPDGPVFLDAECAWYGDPVFDIAFCLNHLLLKCLWNPGARAGFLASFDRLAASWLAGVTWEAPAAAEARAATLLPGLFLARVDGKSPVEYLTLEADRDRVRRVARRLLQSPVARLDAVRSQWEAELHHA